MIAGIDLSRKTAVVTGGYSGIGVETTRALAGAGATVWVPCRNLTKAEETLRDVSGDVRVTPMDLGDLDSVSACAAAILATTPSVDILINNAGIMACPETRTAQGWEQQFAINHVGHFVFTKGLMPGLSEGSRVVCLSSTAHRMTGIRWDDIHFDNEPYDKWQAYGQAKTANALFAVGLKQRGIEAFSVHPGGIQTPLQRHLPMEEMVAMGWVDENGELSEQAKLMFKSVEAGAATAVWCATDPRLAGRGGVYCEDCDIAKAATESSPPWNDVREHATDPAQAERLWTLTEAMLSA